MSSPGTYLRCSENSTLNPWNGLAWRPEKKPSTMKRALRSRPDTWRIVSGRRYFSASPATSGLLHLRGRRAGGFLRERLDLRLGHGLDQPLHQPGGVDALGLGLEAGRDAVAQHGERHVADVLGGDVEPAVHRRERLRAPDEELARAGPGAPLDEVLHEVRGARAAGPRRADERGRVVHHVRGGHHLLQELLALEDRV